MEIGETVTAAMNKQRQALCAICDHDHPGAKRIKITKTAGKDGWGREESMAGKLEATPTKFAIYPGGDKNAYSTEGHHCLAFSAFVPKGEDFILRLNFFLDKGGYKPNREQNSILLPGRPDYHAFWTSIDLGKPLQLHIGNHQQSFFNQTKTLLVRIASFVNTRPHICEDETMDDMIRYLVQWATFAENRAFAKIAHTDWELHPKHIPFALEMYWAPKTVTEKSPTRRPIVGHGGTAIPNGATPKWPVVQLEEGIFED